MRYGIVLLLAVLLASVPTGAVEIGEQVDGLTFKDIRYLPRTLADFGARKAYVFGVTAEDSEDARTFVAALEKLNETYREKGVEVAHLNSGTALTTMDVAAQAIELDAALTLLTDRDASAAKALGVDTPETVVVLDAAGALRYRGNIDEADAALQAVLSGDDVPAATTPVAEGTIPVRTVPEPDGPVTFTKDIAPILYANCAECHLPGEAAPFSLLKLSRADS